jgi:hypothetical protein
MPKITKTDLAALASGAVTAAATLTIGSDLERRA